MWAVPSVKVVFLKGLSLKSSSRLGLGSASRQARLRRGLLGSLRCRLRLHLGGMTPNKKATAAVLFPQVKYAGLDAQEMERGRWLFVLLICD